MSTAPELMLMISGTTKTSAVRFTVYLQDWWEGGFVIEAIGEERENLPQYWLGLKGYHEPKTGLHPLDGDSDDEACILVEFGRYNQEVQPIHSGKFELNTLEYNARLLQGSFEFICYLSDEILQVECWDFIIGAPVSPARAPGA